MRRDVVFQKGGVYHIFSRGNRKELIFISSEDLVRFEERLWYYSQSIRIKVLCYCLMRNHFHLLLQQKSVTDVSHLMHRLLLSHAKYFNRRYNMVGHVFQGRFGARALYDYFDEIRVVKYIYENPVRKRYVERSCDYRWLWVDPDHFDPRKLQIG